LRSATRSAESPNRRFTTYWATRGELRSDAQELLDRRSGVVVTITDADSFFV
jgi:hypothetical protein